MGPFDDSSEGRYLKKARHNVCTLSFLFDRYQSTLRREFLLFTFSSFFLFDFNFVHFGDGEMVWDLSSDS